jgi:hypothetical protein
LCRGQCCTCRGPPDSGRADSERERSRAQLARVGRRREGEGAAGAGEERRRAPGDGRRRRSHFPCSSCFRPGPARVWKHGGEPEPDQGRSSEGHRRLGRRAGREATTAPRRLLDAQSAGLLLGFRRIAELGAGKRRPGGRRVDGGIASGGDWRDCAWRRAAAAGKWGSKMRRLRRA